MMVAKKNRVEASPPSTGTDEVLWHWYSLTWVWFSVEGRIMWTSTCQGFALKDLGWLALEAARQKTQAPQGAVLISVCYLGHGSNDVFYNQECAINAPKEG